MTKLQSLRSLIWDRLDRILIAVIVIQPFLNILSYWTAQLGLGNTLTLLLRFGVLGAVTLTGLLLAEDNRPWLVGILGCVLFWACHCAVCAWAGYENMFTDGTNFIRVIQMPVLAGCFILFLHRKPELLATLELGLTINFWVIALMVVLSVLTGTSAMTYSYNEYGVMGWAANSNAQSAMLSALGAIVVLRACEKGSPLFLAATVAAAFAQLYFLGTRLAFAAIVAIAVGGVLSMVLAGRFSLPRAAMLLVGMAVCLLTFRLSPMYQNQYTYNSVMDQKQGWEGQIYEKTKQELLENDPGLDPAQATDGKSQIDQKAMEHIYEYYAPTICARFGTETVMEAYGYTQNVRTITATRPQKILYCRLLLQEYPFAAKLFGMELSKMTYDGMVFDVENDFHGIFFLYGGVGLGLMLLFLLYFVWRIARSLIRDFRGCFTLEMAGLGLAFLLMLIHCYFTAGVLRRPESSFYLSAVLAGIWQLTRPHQKEETP